MKLREGTYFEEHAGKKVYLVLEDKELLLEGTVDRIVSKLYHSEMDEVELEKEIPGATEVLESLKDWIE